MLTPRQCLCLSIIAFLLLVHLCFPLHIWSRQREENGRGQWLTFGHDPQRSGWASDEHSFRPQNVSQMRMVWKALLPDEPHVLSGLTAPLVVNNVATAEGPRALVIVGGSSDHLFALDADTGALLWKVDFPVKEKPRRPDSWLCPNALTATPVIDPQRGRVFAVASDGRLYTLALRDGKELQPALRFLPAFSKMWSLNYVDGLLYSTLSQDCNEARSAVYAINPDKVGHPVTIFWSAQNCGGGFCGAGIWGRGGVAADFQGFLYAATGDAKFDPAANQFGISVVRLEPGLQGVRDYYIPPNREYIDKLDLDLGNTTPVVFRWRDRVLMAVGGKEGLIYLIDAASMGGTDHQKAVYVSPLYSNEIQSFQKNGVWGNASSWTDSSGNVWLYVPTWGPPVAAQDKKFQFTYGEASGGSVMAFKVVADKSGTPILQPVWRSRNMSVPEPVAIAGGVVFALETGEDTTQATVDQFKELIFSGDKTNVLNSNQRLQYQNKKGRTAVLYALDAQTGRELWNSGKAITDWMHFTGVTVGAGKVFVATNHGELYAFGLTPEIGVKSYRPANSPTPQSKSETPASPISAAAQLTTPTHVKKPLDPLAVSLFLQNCAVCHGQTGTGDLTFRTPNFTKQEWQASHSDAALSSIIANGKEGGMPAFKTRLTADQIGKLVNLIRAFADVPTEKSK